MPIRTLFVTRFYEDRIDDAAPGRSFDAPEDTQPFFYAEPAVGSVFLWESWLRHEVVAGAAKAERISISFNYA